MGPAWMMRLRQMYFSRSPSAGFAGFLLSLKTGVVPTEIAASSILDYNTFLHTYPDFGTDCILLNMGAKTTNLLFAT